MINFIKRLKRKIFDPKQQAQGRGIRARSTKVNVVHDWFEDENFKTQMDSQKEFMEQCSQSPTRHGDYDVESVKSAMSECSLDD